MADNYIEKQMEALRQGRLHIKAKPGIKPKAKRILIAEGTKGPALDKALEYRKACHRVAIFDEDTKVGKRLAHDHGVRFHRVVLHDEASLSHEIHSLLRAWRGLDILIGDENICRILSKIITDWKNSLPLPDKSGLEVVII